MKHIIKWLKQKLGITALEEQNKRLRSIIRDHETFVADKISELKDYTRVDADIGCRGECTIILTGVYRNKAFVRYYDLPSRDFEGIVEHMKNLKQHALIRNVDCPPGGVFSTYFDMDGY